MVKNDSPKIRQRVSSPKTILQRFPNVSVPQKPFAKDSPACQFSKSHSPKIRLRFAKDSPTCQFAKTHSPKIPQRFANVSVAQKPFPKDSPKIRQRVRSPKAICQRFANDWPKIRQRVSSPKTIRQRFANVSVPQKPFAKDSPKIRQRFAKDSPKIRQRVTSPMRKYLIRRLRGGTKKMYTTCLTMPLFDRIEKPQNSGLFTTALQSRRDKIVPSMIAYPLARITSRNWLMC